VGSKSVINGAVGTSSKSGSLLAGLVDGKATGGSKRASKSVVGGSSVPSSASAQLLGSSQAGEEAKKDNMESEAKSGSARPRSAGRSKGESKTVITGMASNSNASQLLAGLTQSQPMKRSGSR